MGGCRIAGRQGIFWVGTDALKAGAPSVKPAGRHEEGRVSGFFRKSEHAGRSEHGKPEHLANGDIELTNARHQKEHHEQQI